MKFRKTRLQNIEEKRNLRQAIFFFLLTLILLFILFFVGLPLVIKLSVILGNRNQPSQYTDINQLDNPVQPHLESLPQATNSATLFLHGNAPAGMKIKVFLNETLLDETTANNDGEFSLTQLQLKDGKNVIKAVSVVNDKESEPALLNVVYKTTPPKLEITKPDNNANYYDQENEVNIEGLTDPQCLVTINEHQAIVENDGSFSFRVNLKEGTNEFTITSQDEAGNQNKSDLKVNYSP